MTAPSGAGATDPSLFYTGLVAELYGPLRSTTFNPDTFARLIRRFGEPALELGCGDGHPIVHLRGIGLDVEGLDSSPDMLDRCRREAAARGVEVTLHLQTMEAMALARRYRTIFLAGATFNLLPDDEAALQALRRIRAHLEDDGTAIVPLFVPTPTDEADLGHLREVEGPDGARLRVGAVAETRDELRRTQATVLRYERVTPAGTDALERPWVVHWHSPDGFRSLAAEAGLVTSAVSAVEGGPAGAGASQFVVRLAPAS